MSARTWADLRQRYVNNSQPSPMRPDRLGIPVPAMTGAMPPELPDESLYDYVRRINKPIHSTQARHNRWADTSMPGWRETLDALRAADELASAA